MADIELLIKISKEDYEKIMSLEQNTTDYQTTIKLYQAVKDGIPLPKVYGMKFEKIVVSYPPAEICTYPEYKDKPYFQIKYEENGQDIVGFGTYKPEVLSRYLRDYFITSTIESDNMEGEE